MKIYVTSTEERATVLMRPFSRPSGIKQATGDYITIETHPTKDH